MFVHDDLLLPVVASCNIVTVILLFAMVLLLVNLQGDFGGMDSEFCCLVAGYFDTNIVQHPFILFLGFRPLSSRCWA